jgi:WD40-like Beta Propeller Repeat
LPDGTFGNARLIPELSAPGQNGQRLPWGNQRPSIRYDGLEIFFFSNRPVQNAMTAPSIDIWVATRNSVNDSWDPPVNLGPGINSPSSEINPQISADGLTLYFASNRTTALDAGGNSIAACGGLDLYTSTRTKLKRKNDQE